MHDCRSQFTNSVSWSIRKAWVVAPLGCMHGLSPWTIFHHVLDQQEIRAEVILVSTYRGNVAFAP